MPTLRQLKAEFVRLEIIPNKLIWIVNDPSDTSKGSHKVRRSQTVMHVVDSIEEAQGVMFLCPKCFKENGGTRGTHAIVCWSRSRGIPDDVAPKPGRWSLIGKSLDDLTLNGDAVDGDGARSVLLLAGCVWHGFVTDGVAE